MDLYLRYNLQLFSPACNHPLGPDVPIHLKALLQECIDIAYPGMKLPEIFSLRIPDFPLQDIEMHTICFAFLPAYFALCFDQTWYSTNHRFPAPPQTQDQLNMLPERNF